jgi:hypothetical protein
MDSVNVFASPDNTFFGCLFIAMLTHGCLLLLPASNRRLLDRLALVPIVFDLTVVFGG